ncbi:MAG: ethylbenzene dehydrogenase-related protein [Alphaproteobacteria bacterium]
MSLLGVNLFRRSVLLALLAGTAAVLSRVRPGQAQEKASLIAKAVESVPKTPDDAAWQTADALPVPLAPQAVVKPRLYETGVTSVTVRALYDAERLAFLLTWADPRADAEFAGVADFRDAVALEFPADPTAGVPYFAMGEPGKPVTIYQWKADWQFSPGFDASHRDTAMQVDWYPFTGRAPGEIAEIADYGGAVGDRVFHTSWSAGSPLGNSELQARTPVEKLQAEGFGTLTSVDVEAQDATGLGQSVDGTWQVLITIPRDQGGIALEPGMTLPMAFAVWDGARDERGGEKAVSTWYFMSLERPVGTAIYWAPLLAAAGVAVAQLGGLSALRRAMRLKGSPQHGDRT